MAGLLLGVPWGVWHMMAGFMGSTPGHERIKQRADLMAQALTPSKHFVITKGEVTP